jgi:hypothetical protein
VLQHVEGIYFGKQAKSLPKSGKVVNFISLSLSKLYLQKRLKFFQEKESTFFVHFMYPPMRSLFFVSPPI